jgi:hypothetical protein
LKEDLVNGFTLPKHKEDLSWVQGLLDLVKDQFVGGCPKHLVDPENSMIKVISHSAFKGLSHQESQTLVANHHVLVTGIDTPKYKFDHKGLRTLAPRNKVFTIHGKYFL